jgi:hypothetical protein
MQVCNLVPIPSAVLEGNCTFERKRGNAAKRKPGGFVQNRKLSRGHG